MKDCRHGEDESGCERYQCPGFYRCRLSSICLHPHHVCDLIKHCPLHDDEYTCTTACPRGCHCLGLEYTCTIPFQAQEHPQIKFLNGEGSRIQIESLHNNRELIFLNLAKCDISNISDANVLNFPNLQHLDLSFNEIQTFDMENIFVLKNLRFLSLTDNPLTKIIHISDKDQQHVSLRTLDLSYTHLQFLNKSTFQGYASLQTLNLSLSKVSRIDRDTFTNVSNLKVIDLRVRSNLLFPAMPFKDLVALERIYASNYKICCKVILELYKKDMLIT